MLKGSGGTENLDWVCESNSVHDLNEDLTSACRKDANGNIGLRKHICIYLFIKLHFHMTCTIKQHKLQPVLPPFVYYASIFRKHVKTFTVRVTWQIMKPLIAYHQTVCWKIISLVNLRLY